jgi:hypothetical protein
MAKKRPTKISLTRVRDEARGCRACDLYKHATQTVFGEGPARAGLRREMKQFTDDLRAAVRALSST